MGQESLSGNFGQRHSGFGEVFGGQSSNVIFVAMMDIVVQRTGHVRFSMNGDDGFELSIDGRKVIDGWRGGRLRGSSVHRFELLEPGLHTLQMRYFEGVGESILRFETDQEVLEWTEVVCKGARNVPPSTRYFAYRALGETPEAISNRFAVPVDEILSLNNKLSRLTQISGSVVLPGSGQQAKNRKLIVLQGIDSSAEIPIDAIPPNFPIEDI